VAKGVEMKREDVDISKLKYDPFDPSTVNKVEDDFGSFDLGVDKVKAITYLILFYDFNSFFVREYKDVIERRIKCAEMCDFPKKGKVYDKAYEDLIVGDNPQFNSLAYLYIMSFGSPEYMALQMFLKYYSELYVSSTKNFDPKDYKDNINNIKSLLADINKLTEDLFSGKESLNMRMALYAGIEKNILLPKPEIIANADNLDEVIGKGPYKGYKPEKLKYKSHK
jgi:hypothetical protein